MSLGKLLTTGKSLIGLHNAGARYRMREKNPLPKFESAKNPFGAKGQAEDQKEPQLPKMTPEEIAAANMKKTQVLPVLGAKSEVVAPVAQAARQTEPVNPSSAVEGWVKKLNPLVWWENRKPAPAKSAVPRFSKTPVQGELSLDNIKVMRNDLNEADVEVVPAKPKVAKVPKVADVASVSLEAPAAAMAIPELPPAKDAWEYLGERLLGKH